MDVFVVKALRQNLGLSQSDFAREVGVKQQTISKVEAGVMPLSDRLKNRIIYRFNVKQDEIDAIKALKNIRNGGVNQ
ncbi:helix-turn-helix transcriptional regulator [Neobacillus sp. YIM B02564]|uniref:Helix-turn-helix transcriptional regulator n=1 Tax=Neobacillus paridis TaxID=2803862 RepID=A0ABS1TJ75_9BACI|nr:helix-turn-helix transcriptional regulator [Neobacillus paridis]MBL4951312.1 helix-turn-helix transcriptional regulator [Neobacillus paridis]